jgi:hypothetical protein
VEAEGETGLVAGEPDIVEREVRFSSSPKFAGQNADGNGKACAGPAHDNARRPSARRRSPLG